MAPQRMINNNESGRRAGRRRPTTTNNNNIILVVLTLSASAFALVQFVHLQHLMSSSISISTASASDNDASSQNNNSPPQNSPYNHNDIIKNDGTLLWITPKPSTPRIIGWEDDYMTQFKHRHYKDTQKASCKSTHDTPYNDNLLCEIPAYIPARYVTTTTTTTSRNNNSNIPKVIFISWFNRHLGRTLFTSILTLLHHNPEYEFIFFNDDDIDEFICQNNAVDDTLRNVFSKVKAGAMRVDIWRLVVMQLYGGVYLDSDMSAVGMLPIGVDDSVVSGLGCWGHLPLLDKDEEEEESIEEEEEEEEEGDSGDEVVVVGGLLEHWAMAFIPHHPLIELSVETTTQNLLRPEYLIRDDTPEAKAEDSVTMRLTGPAMYQFALHTILKKSKCRLLDNSYCDALQDPTTYCEDMDTFHSYFPGGLTLFQNTNLNQTVVHKLFHPAGEYVRETEDVFEVSGGKWDYDHPDNVLGNLPDANFCYLGEMKKRAADRISIWNKAVEKLGNE